VPHDEIGPYVDSILKDMATGEAAGLEGRYA
jgi:hypothetical protein